MKKYKLEMLPDDPEVKEMKHLYSALRDERQNPNHGRFQLPSREKVPFVKKDDKLFRRVWDEKIDGERLVELDPSRLADWEKRSRFVDLDALTDVYETYGSYTPTDAARKSELTEAALAMAALGTGSKLAAYGVLGTSNPATLPTALFAIPTLLGELGKKASIPEGYEIRDQVIVDPTDKADSREAMQGYLDRGKYRDTYKEKPKGVTEKEYAKMFAKEMESQGKVFDSEKKRWVPKMASGAFQLCMENGKKRIKKKSFKEAIVFQQAGLHPAQESYYQDPSRKRPPTKPDNRLGQAVKKAPQKGGDMLATEPGLVDQFVGAAWAWPAKKANTVGDWLGIKNLYDYTPASWVQKGLENTVGSKDAQDWSIDLLGGG